MKTSQVAVRKSGLRTRFQNVTSNADLNRHLAQHRLCQEEEEFSVYFLVKSSETITIRLKLLASYLMDYNLGTLQWYSLIKFIKTSQRLC